MNLPQDHMPFQQCIDILEWNIGDKKDIPVEWQTGVHVVQATRIAIEALKDLMEKDSITIFGKKLKKLEFPPQHLDEYLEYLKTCDISIPLNEMKEDWNKMIECWNKIGEEYIVQFSDKTNV